MTAGLELTTSSGEPLLARGMTAMVSAEASAPGVIRLAYPVDAPRVSQLGTGLTVWPRITDTAPLVGTEQVRPLAPYVILDQRIDWAATPPSYVWSGTQQAFVSMTKTLVHRNYFAAGVKPITRWTGNAGHIISAVKFYADDSNRNALRRVGIIGNADADADLIPWLVEFDQSRDCPYDMTLDQLVDDIVTDSALEWDLWVPPLGTTGPDPDAWSYLRLYNPGNLGRDLTAIAAGAEPVIITDAGAEQAPETTSTYDFIKRVLAYNSAGVVAIAEGPLAVDMPEIGMQLDLDTEEQLSRAANRWLARHNRTDESLTVALTDPSQPTPGLDVQVGDWVMVSIAGATPDRRRLSSWSLALDADGALDAAITVGDPRRIRGKRVEQRLAELERRTSALAAEGAANA